MGESLRHGFFVTKREKADDSRKTHCLNDGSAPQDSRQKVDGKSRLLCCGGFRVSLLGVYSKHLFFVEILFGDVVLRHFMGVNFSFAVRAGIFDTLDHISFECVSLFEQFVHAL